MVDAAQEVVIETLREAQALGFIEPRLVGAPDAIMAICEALGWKLEEDWIVPASSDAAAAAVELARAGGADAVMKGNILPMLSCTRCLTKNMRTSSPATSSLRTWNILPMLLPPGSPWGWPCQWC